MPTAPHAVSPPALPDVLTERMLLAYAEWLFNERRILCHLMGWEERLVVCTEANHFHFPCDTEWTEVPSPMSRAVLMLEAAGLDLDALRAWARDEEESGHTLPLAKSTRPVRKRDGLAA